MNIFSIHLAAFAQAMQNNIYFATVRKNAKVLQGLIRFLYFEQFHNSLFRHVPNKLITQHSSLKVSVLMKFDGVTVFQYLPSHFVVDNF